MSAIGRIKEFTKNDPHLGTVYERLRTWKADCLRKKAVRLQKKRLQGKYRFEDRSRGCDKLCIVLSGYKEYLWPAVFGRLKRFAPEDIDVCVLSSGKYSEELSRICAENRWSYLSTQENQVCAIQNIAIDKFPNADYIYKLDEDIFITEDYFENMMRAYDHAWKGDYEPGVIAPLIPINGYGYVRILRKLNLMDEYGRRFERAKHSTGIRWKLESDAEAAFFFWGEGGFVPSIDEMNARFSREEAEERPCPIRFNIGAILFKRELWQDMGYFPVHAPGGGTGLGVDEISLCRHCNLTCRPLMVSENIVVGHLAFTLQNEAMKEYYLSHTEVFSLP